MGLEGAPGLNAMKARKKEHEDKRGVKEEVGVSSSAAMAKAIENAKLKSKEEAAVKKAKKVKEEMNIDETRLKGSPEGVTLKPRYGDHLGDMYSKDPDEGDLETSLKDSAKKRRADTIRPLKQKVKATAKKMKKEEVAPAVDKVIESIKINKASPKSPNCIIMPKKDDIADKAGGNGKKSTKNVVSKKQKQFFNQEGKTYKSFAESAVKILTGAGAAAAKKGAITVASKGGGKLATQGGGALVKEGGGALV